MVLVIMMILDISELEYLEKSNVLIGLWFRFLLNLYTFCYAIDLNIQNKRYVNLGK